MYFAVLFICDCELSYGDQISDQARSRFNNTLIMAQVGQHWLRPKITRSEEYREKLQHIQLFTIQTYSCQSPKISEELIPQAHDKQPYELNPYHPMSFSLEFFSIEVATGQHVFATFVSHHLVYTYLNL